MRTAILALSLLAVSTQAASLPGLSASITAVGLNKANNIATPYIFDKLVDVSVPDVSFSGGSLSNIKATVHAPADVTDIKWSLDNAHNGVNLAGSDISSSMTADFTFKYLFIVATGQAKINIAKVGLDVEVDLLSQSTPTGLAPKIKAQTVKVDVNPANVDIVLTGNDVTKFASLLIPLIKDTLTTTVVADLEAAVTNIINVKVNKDLLTYGTDFALPDFEGVTVDNHLLGAPVVAADNSYIGAAVNASFFEAGKTGAKHLTPAKIPVRLASGPDVQIYLTDFIAKTFLQALEYQQVISASKIAQDWLNYTITTDDMSVAFPTFNTTFGSKRPVEVTFSVNGDFDFDFKTAGCALTAAPKSKVTITLATGGKTVVSADLIQAEFVTGPAFVTKTNRIGLDITSWSVAGVAVNTLNYPGLTPAQFATEFTTFFTEVENILTALLAKGFQIPNIFGIVFSDVTVSSNDGFLGLGLSVDTSAGQKVE
jgi:hypothetical protein